jgi:hypothetical protein
MGRTFQAPTVPLGVPGVAFGQKAVVADSVDDPPRHNKDRECDCRKDEHAHRGMGEARGL